MTWPASTQQARRAASESELAAREQSRRLERQRDSHERRPACPRTASLGSCTAKLAVEAEAKAVTTAKLAVEDRATQRAKARPPHRRHRAQRREGGRRRRRPQEQDAPPRHPPPPTLQPPQARERQFPPPWEHVQPHATPHRRAMGRMLMEVLRSPLVDRLGSIDPSCRDQHAQKLK